MRQCLRLLLILLLCSAPVRADWINLTGAETSPNIAEIYVQDDQVKLVLEVFIGDLDTFEPLIPDDWLKDGAGKRPALDERLSRFATEVFQLVKERGVDRDAHPLRSSPGFRAYS